MKVHELLSTLETPPEYAWVTPSFQLYLDDKCIYDSEGKDLKEYYRVKTKYANYEVKWATIEVDYCDYGSLIIHMEREDKNNNNDKNAEKWRHFELTT